MPFNHQRNGHRSVYASAGTLASKVCVVCDKAFTIGAEAVTSRRAAPDCGSNSDGSGTVARRGRSRRWKGGGVTAPRSRLARVHLSPSASCA